MNIVDWREKGPAYFLWLIREGKAKSLDDLANYFATEKCGSSERYHLLSLLQGSVSRFIAAGLVEEVEGQLMVTGLLSKIQGALDLSLTRLAETSRTAISADPLFGPPRSSVRHDVFVLMPFTSELQPVYADHIKNVAKKLNISAGRADDFFTTHAIIQDIWSAIFSSKVLISDCSGRNPNVFYETGIAHTLGRPVVLIAQRLDDIPFDLRHLRVIEYSLTPRGMKLFEETLCKTLRAFFPDAKVVRPRSMVRKSEERNPDE